MSKRLGSIFLVLTVRLVSPFAAVAQQAKGRTEEIAFWYSANAADPSDLSIKWQANNIKLFMTLHPGITINPTAVANGDEYLSKISTAMAAGTDARRLRGLDVGAPQALRR